MTDQHTKFLSRLDKSRAAVFKVAEYLSKAGFTVTIPAIKFAPTAKDHKDYVDEGDIIAVRGVDRHKVEVKHIDTDFKDLATWPHPVVFVSNVGTVDRAGDTVSAYVIVNKPMTHIGIIWTTTKPKWSIKDVYAKNTGNMERNYCCSPDLVDFREL